MGQAAQELTLKLIARTPQCCRCVTYANGANASLPFKPGNGNTSVPESHNVRRDRNRYVDFGRLGPLMLSKQASTFSVVRNSALF
jgi:hypothetical protein